MYKKKTAQVNLEFDGGPYYDGRTRTEGSVALGAPGSLKPFQRQGAGLEAWLGRGTFHGPVVAARDVDDDAAPGHVEYLVVVEIRQETPAFHGEGLVESWRVVGGVG
jgi:hypothetical protein